MKIPYLSLEIMHNEIKDSLLNACERVIESNSFILGNELEEFEKAFAEFCVCPMATIISLTASTTM